MNKRPLSRLLVITLLTLVGNYPSSASIPQRTRAVEVSESRVLQDVAERRKKNPPITAAELARYANELLEKRQPQTHHNSRHGNSCTKPQ